MNLTSKIIALNSTSLAKQSGAVMAISLILLVLLTLVGVTSSQITGIQEKMAGNMYDRNVAFQAAEAALRDGEREISLSINNPNYRFCALINFNSDCGVGTASRFDDGICDVINGANPTIWLHLVNIGVWNNQTVMRDWPSIPYGYFSDLPAIGNVSAQPRYLIEGFPGAGNDNAFFYRITARGQGMNPNTEVWLQSAFNIPQSNCN